MRSFFVIICIFCWFENSKGACIKVFLDDFVWLKYFLIDSCQQELSTKICCDLISAKLVFKLIYITIIFTVCCFVQKDYFNLNYRRTRKSFDYLIYDTYRIYIFSYGYKIVVTNNHFNNQKGVD